MSRLVALSSNGAVRTVAPGQRGQHDCAAWLVTGLHR